MTSSAADEKQLFARLSVFAGGCYAGRGPKRSSRLTSTALQSLLDKSLVRRTDERFLDAGDESASSPASASPPRTDVERDRSPARRSGFLALAERGRARFLKGAEQASWLQRLEDEHDNLRSSLDWFFRPR